MDFDHHSLPLLAEALKRLEAGFASLPDLPPPEESDAMAEVLGEVASRLHDNYPYHHPFYMGQMMKPPHPIARLAYALAMWLNPNNHALDGGRASSAMEKEAVAEIARMFGWHEHLGHLCGGGTMANFEALWVARELSSPHSTPLPPREGRPPDSDSLGPQEEPSSRRSVMSTMGVAASEQAHYTHERLCAVLQTPFVKVPADPRGRMDPKRLERIIKTGRIGTVVATLGTTAAGAVDPLPAILDLRDRYSFRLHVDAAYGGYFKLAGNLSQEARASFDRIAEADSIVVDPHKHGLQPYGCGCILFKDPAVGRIYRHESPYTYFTSSALHLGEISLECSRPGAAAVGLWATQRLLPLVANGRFAGMLEACREAALALHAFLEEEPRFAPLFTPELDIVVWAVRSRRASEASQLARRIFAAAAQRDVHLALASFPRPMLEPLRVVDRWDDDKITCLRACAMKPEHKTWMPKLVKRIAEATNIVLGNGR